MSTSDTLSERWLTFGEIVDRLGTLSAHLTTQSQQAPDTSLPVQVSLLRVSLHEMSAIMLHLGRALDHVEQIAHEQQAERKAAHDA